jgi:hypothetical protein
MAGGAEVSEAQTVDRFNEQHPIGTPVRYWPAIRSGEGRESVTRTPARLVCGAPCVSVEGYPGAIALTHVEVQP